MLRKGTPTSIGKQSTPGCAPSCSDLVIPHFILYYSCHPFHYGGCLNRSKISSDIWDISTHLVPYQNKIEYCIDIDSVGLLAILS